VSLLELRRDAGELAVERAAERVHNGDDRNGNASGDQTVFDSGRTGLILQKRNNLGNESPVLGCRSGPL
jgi:hypothetical protein